MQTERDRGTIYLAPLSLWRIARYTPDMTNTIAIWLGCIIVGIFALDFFVLHQDLPQQVIHGLIFLIEKVAFWR